MSPKSHDPSILYDEHHRNGNLIQLSNKGSRCNDSISDKSNCLPAQVSLVTAKIFLTIVQRDTNMPCHVIIAIAA